MKNFRKIIGINLLILLAYNVLFFASSFSSGITAIYTFSIYIILSITAQVLTNFILALYFFSVKKGDIGKSYLLSTAVVLIIGFSTCLGGVSLLDAGI